MGVETRGSCSALSGVVMCVPFTIVRFGFQWQYFSKLALPVQTFCGSPFYISDRDKCLWQFHSCFSEAQTKAWLSDIKTAFKTTVVFFPEVLVGTMRGAFKKRINLSRHSNECPVHHGDLMPHPTSIPESGSHDSWYWTQFQLQQQTHCFDMSCGRKKDQTRNRLNRDLKTNQVWHVLVFQQVCGLRFSTEQDVPHGGPCWENGPFQCLTLAGTLSYLQERDFLGGVGPALCLFG